MRQQANTAANVDLVFKLLNIMEYWSYGVPNIMGDVFGKLKVDLLNVPNIIQFIEGGMIPYT